MWLVSLLLFGYQRGAINRYADLLSGVASKNEYDSELEILIRIRERSSYCNDQVCRRKRTAKSSILATFLSSSSM
jgi:hypothetical protein